MPPAKPITAVTMATKAASHALKGVIACSTEPTSDVVSTPPKKPSQVRLALISGNDATSGVAAPDVLRHIADLHDQNQIKEHPGAAARPGFGTSGIARRGRLVVQEQQRRA